MKKISIIATVCLATVAAVSLMAFNTKTTAGNPYILIEIYEVPNYPDRGVHIHYGGNKREIVPFKSMNVEDHDEAGEIVLATVNKFVAQGYSIESTAAGLAQSGMITKIFMRKD